MLRRVRQSSNLHSYLWSVHETAYETVMLTFPLLFDLIQFCPCLPANVVLLQCAAEMQIYMLTQIVSVFDSSDTNLSDISMWLNRINCAKSHQIWWERLLLIFYRFLSFLSRKCFRNYHNFVLHHVRPQFWLVVVVMLHLPCSSVRKPHSTSDVHTVNAVPNRFNPNKLGNCFRLL